MAEILDVRNPGLVLLADHGVLAQRPRELLGRGDGRIAGLQPPDDFDQAHQHDGVEKMQADDTVSGLGEPARDRRDGQLRGVRAVQRAGPGNSHRLAQDRLLDRQHLDDGLENQVSPRRGLGEGAGQPHPAQRLLAGPPVQAALTRQLVDARADQPARALELFRCHIAKRDLVPRHGCQLSDTRAHDSRAHDSHPGDLLIRLHETILTETSTSMLKNS
jgi:hypothetical protein